MKSKILLIFLLTTVISFGQINTKINKLIKNEINAGKVPALAVAVIDDGKIVHLSANGLRDVQLKKKATINTPFHIASVSKTVTNMAVFKLVEMGKIDLKTDINTYLPFKVENPFFPNEKITVELLLKHRSGIKDDVKFYIPFWSNPKGDSNLNLHYLKDYLSPEGKLYKKSHYDDKPNHKSVFKYSNTGIALLGYIVEQVSKMSYENFCQQYIFKPMKMNNSSWFLKNLDSSLVAKTYIKSKSKGFIFKGHNGYPDYPGGQLRTSITDYSTLIAGFLNADNNQFILKNRTKNLIVPKVNTPHLGYYTWFIKAINNNLYYEHGGGDTGVRTISIIEPTKKRAIIIFANHPYAFDDLYRNIEKKMWEK
ncbi:serine hydrolase domain-containing protein [Tenacibaculum retecalamus]|uniref:serine hydrolase domain-containing protein n=1 Tax=Tenacibaculum retecalamus TaxID=3018315 RepID=UPI0023D91A9C|nr:serine hydrolase [Tenacibaculum retecalamus]WBX71190.1 serine hydrolase [Tenacibaculum retecalamus]